MYEIIDEVARHGSFVRAAEALRLTPSAVSHAVSALEEELGFRLFNRGRGGVTLTDEGARMLEHVRAIRDRERLMQEEARQIRGLASGRVNIGTFSSVLVSWLTDALHRFRSSCPGVEVNIFQGDYEDVERWVRNGDVEIGFDTLPAGEGFRVEQVARDRLLLVAPPDFRPAGGRAVTAEEIRSGAECGTLPLIVRRAGYNKDAEAFLKAHLAEVPVHYRIDDDRSIFALIEANLGAALLPELTLSHIGFHVSVWPLAEEVFRTIGLIVRRDRVLSPAAARFVEEVKRGI